jgi:hypothetical protein
MDTYLKSSPGNPKYDYSKTRSLMIKGIVKYYLFRSSWNRIGESNGFNLHTDFLHLNDIGADIVAELIAGFILKSTE